MQSVVAVSSRAVFIYSDLSRSKLSLLGELSQRIMRPLSVTVILTVRVYMVCSQFTMTLVIK